MIDTLAEVGGPRAVLRWRRRPSLATAFRLCESLNSSPRHRKVHPVAVPTTPRLRAGPYFGPYFSVAP